MIRQRLLVPLVAVLALVPASATSATSAKAQAKVEPQAGVRHVHFRFGAVRARTGQNTIVFRDTRRRPTVDHHHRIHPFMRGAFRV